MKLKHTQCGILIDEKYLTAPEALALLHWLSEQQDVLLILSQENFCLSPEPDVVWNLADEQEMISEDEQIARCDF